MKKVLILVLFIGLSFYSDAQCAMCKATLENNIANGDLSIASSINAGILYLFVAPYLALGALAWGWYRASRKSIKKPNLSQNVN